MNNQLVSICIPCYNAEAYVGAAIDSILSQSWAAIEIVVVDDGSTDRSLNILQARASASKSIKVIHQENKGQCAAANRALEASTGDLIKFFDADDLLSPFSIEAQVARLNGRDNVIASSTWGRFYNDDLTTFCLNPESVWRDMPSLAWLVEAWKGAEPMMQCALWLIPRSLLERAGNWDESLTLINDFEFFARVLCHAEEVCFTPGARLYYRSGISGSLSSRKSRAAAVSAFHSILKGTNHLLTRRSDPEAKLSCANMMQSFVYAFYPEYLDLRSDMSARIAELGGSNLLPSGGPLFQRTQRIIGWKAARRLQRAVAHF